MRVLMLGWEFPPNITGGLGVACAGLSRAMTSRGIGVLFIAPRREPQVVTPPSKRQPTRASPRRRTAPKQPTGSPPAPASADDAETSFQLVTVPSLLTSPYGGGRSWDPRPMADHSGRTPRSDHPRPTPPAISASKLLMADRPAVPPVIDLYTGDLIAEADRYAAQCLRMTRGKRFDIVHAHDWLTFPAAQRISRREGVPWVAHIHSTEFDRAGANAHTDIRRIERDGLLAADSVLCVSFRTRRMVINTYGVPESRVHVVYNGIDTADRPAHAPAIAGPESTDRTVLFLGRITSQKGPTYFVRAARLVADRVPDARFVMIGAGDMVEETVRLAIAQGIGERVLFTGFLDAAEVRQVFETAAVLVMPSVSEPFGLAALEAASHNVPVIISRTSGVSEVLSHALTVDFWDVDDIADKIVSVLRHPPMEKSPTADTVRELHRLTWDHAAEQCQRVYASLLETSA